MAKKPKAVVLGVGALRGIGGAASRRFAKEGYHVLVAGRTPQKIETVVDAIRKEGGAATAFTIDGTREDQVIRLFDAAMADDNDSLLREVQEEIRREQMEKLWQRYNGLIFGAAALIVFLSRGGS